jgi:hypothetical protein
LLAILLWAMQQEKWLMSKHDPSPTLDFAKTLG